MFSRLFNLYNAICENMRYKTVYKGVAYAMWVPMSYHSADTRFVYVVVGDKVPGHGILVAEVDVRTEAFVKNAGTHVKVFVTVKQRGSRTPEVIEMYVMPESDSDKRSAARNKTEQPSPQPTFAKDYYAVLGVSKTATTAEIEKAYRKLAKACHPDLFPGDKQKERQMKDINEARDVLSDEGKRAVYDRFGN